MKKSNFKKLGIISLLVVMITSFVSGLFVLDTEAKSSAPASFTAKSEKQLAGYIANYHFGKKKTSTGKYVYCNNIHKGTPHGETMTLKGEAPAGIAYILQNGYPSKSITGNSDYDYYITQSAIWWYLDDTTGSSNLSNSFKTTGSDPHGLRKYVKELVTAAKKVKGYSTPSLDLSVNTEDMTESSDGKYYESSDIKVSAKALSSKGATVSLTEAPSGSEIVSPSTGSEISTVKAGDSIKVKIPVDKVEVGKTTVKVKATATGVISKAYIYKSSSSSVQDVYGSALYNDTTSLNDVATVSLTKEEIASKVSIVKIDSKTKTVLAGANFELYDSKGTKITSWTSTTKAHVIQKLPNGTYTLKETKAPTGYKKLEEAKTFTITDTNRDIKIEVENEAITKLVNIVKIDKKTGQPLVGAHLVVKNEKGEVIADFISKEEPYTLTELADGKYSVYEVDAPEGYKKTEATYFFTISDGQPVASVTVENEKIEEVEEQKEQEVTVPDTDSNNSLLSTVLGTIILASGFGFVYHNGKKQEQE